MENTTKNKTVSINGRSFSIELVAKALGIQGPVTSFQVRQPIQDGYLRADLVSPKKACPGIDLVLEKDAMRIPLARVEQDTLAEHDPVIAALYARNGNLMAFMSADTREDDVVAEEGNMDFLIAADFCEVSNLNDYCGPMPEPMAVVPEPCAAASEVQASAGSSAGNYAIIKESFYADRPGSTLSIVATAPTMGAAHEACQKACQAECDELNEGEDICTPPEGCDESCLPDGFRWDDSWTDETEDGRYQYVVRLWSGDDAKLVSGFAILPIEEEAPTSPAAETCIVEEGEFEAGQFLQLNNHRYSLRKIANMLGLKEAFDTIRLCQQVPSGVLAACIDPYQLDYPGIDLVLDVPSKNRDDYDEIMVCRCEQDFEDPSEEADNVPVKAYMYARCGDYIATKEIDSRCDDDFEDGEKKPESLVVGGGYAIGILDVYYEDPRFSNLKGGYTAPDGTTDN